MVYKSCSTFLKKKVSIFPVSYLRRLRSQLNISYLIVSIIWIIRRFGERWSVITTWSGDGIPESWSAQERNECASFVSHDNNDQSILYYIAAKYLIHK